MALIPCMFCPEMACSSSRQKLEDQSQEEKDDVTFTINYHLSFHEHFMFSCAICQLKRYVVPKNFHKLEKICDKRARIKLSQVLIVWFLGLVEVLG